MTEQAYPTPGQKLEDHPYAQIFPMMDFSEKNELGESIRKNGQREPIILLDGKILDGRNRWEECRRVGVEPKFAFYNPRIHGECPIEYVLDHNLVRRQLTPSQRAAVAAELVPLYRDAARKAQSAAGKAKKANLVNKDSQVPACPACGEEAETDHNCKKTEAEPEPVVAPATPVKATQKAAEVAGVSETLVKEAQKLDPEKREEVKAGKATVGSALKQQQEEKLADARAQAIRRISDACGPELAKAIDEGTRLKGGTPEIVAFAALGESRMKELRGLIEDGWKLSDALKYKVNNLHPHSKIGDAIKRAAHAGGEAKILVNDKKGAQWEISVRRVDA